MTAAHLVFILDALRFLKNEPSTPGSLLWNLSINRISTLEDLARASGDWLWLFLDYR